MDRPRLRLLVLLAAAAALAACATVEDAGGEGGGSGAKAAGAKGADGGNEDPDGDLKGGSKAALYHNLRSLTDSWLQAYSESGDSAAGEARSLETAIQGAVLPRLDEILGDLGTSDNPRWRVAAARGLGFIPDDRVVAPLEKALGDPDPSVVTSALVSLAHLGNPGTDDAKIRKFLSFPDKIVQGDAALCLARVMRTRRERSMPAVDPERVKGIESDLLVLLFDTGDPILRGNAAQALGQLRSPTAEDALLNRVRDGHAYVRMKVAQALALAGTPKAYEVLLDSLGREQQTPVRQVTALALGAIAERQGGKPPYGDLRTDAGAWRKWLGR